MNFFDQLSSETQSERENLLASPLVAQALRGELTVAGYAAFLCQAYHHVKHTVPLLMAAGSRIPGDKEWLRSALAEYVEEELGHQEWILNDIEACGYDRQAAINSTPNPATELMVAYAYNVIDRGNPMGFFGMVHVLEGTSISVADSAAQCIQSSTGLPKKAFSYLTSHGALDIAHVEFFKDLMNKIDDPLDQQQIIHCAKMFYGLYGDVYASVDAVQATALAA